jgi:1,2-diacylglycerol 3-alpha-glucosyltransferase
MNIALFVDTYVPIKNGVVTSVLQLKEGLEKKGHNVTVITVEVPDYDEKDKNVFRLPSINAKLGQGTEYHLGIINQSAVTRFLRKREIELIHTHSEFTLGLSGKFAAKKLKVPHIHTTHTMWEEYRHYLWNGKLLSVGMMRKILKTFLKNVSVIIAPSVKAKKYYHNLMPLIPIVVINNGIDEKKFKASNITENEIQLLRKEFNLEINDKLLIFVGRIGKEKRVAELYESIVPVVTKNPDVKMIFVGDGPSLPELIKKTKELGLEKSFIFTGFVNWDIVYRLYSIADVFVTASLSEVHPMTLIEATMCGLSVIVRKDDSYLDLCVNGENGYLVESDEEITEKLNELVSDNGMMKKFSNSSLEISKSFTADNHVEKVEKLYKRMIGLYEQGLDFEE